MTYKVDDYLPYVQPLTMEEFIDLITDLEKIGINVDKYKDKVDNEFNSIIKKEDLTDKEKLNYFNKIITGVTYELHDKYGIYFLIYFQFKIKLSSIDSHLKEKNYYHNISLLDENINDILKNIKRLNKRNTFANNDFTKYNKYINEIIYEYMKLEFLFKGESYIYDNITSNEYLHHFFNKKIKEDVENILYSINYIPGSNELNTIFKNITNENFLSEELIEKVSICSYIEKSKEIITLKLETILKELNYLYKKSNKFINRIGWYKKVLPIKLKQKNIIEDYKNIMNKYGFILDENESIVTEINNKILKLNKKLI